MKLYEDGKHISAEEKFQMIWNIPTDVAEAHFPAKAVAEMRHAMEVLSYWFPGVRFPYANPYAGNPDDDIVDPRFADDDVSKRLDADYDGNTEPCEFPF